MTRKAWSGLLVACVVLVTAFCTTGAGRRDDVRVLQMNLCNSGLAGCYTGRAVATAADVIRAQAPDVVTLNEVCRSDAAVLDRRGTAPPAFRPVPDRRTGGATRCRNGEPYGIAILTRGDESQSRGAPTRCRTPPTRSSGPGSASTRPTSRRAPRTWTRPTPPSRGPSAATSSAPCCPRGGPPWCWAATSTCARASAPACPRTTGAPTTAASRTSW